jgi:hypothetical protein
MKSYLNTSFRGNIELSVLVINLHSISIDEGIGRARSINILLAPIGGLQEENRL